MKIYSILFTSSALIFLKFSRSLLYYSQYIHVKIILNLLRVAVEKEDTEEYRKREEEAEKIANEIESSTSYKNNVDKELSDNEEEEAVFSAVDRINGENNERIDSSSSNVADAFANTKENNVNYNNAHVNTSNRSMKNEEK